MQRFERRHFVRRCSDDELAASRVRDVVCGAEGVEQVAPLDAEPRLQRAGWIVEAGVDDAAVVRAGGPADFAVAFEQADRRAGTGE
jgi:hypothetical protein